MVNRNTFSKEITKKIADLSKIELTEEETSSFSEQFNSTLKVVENLNKLNTSEVEVAYNITGLKNVYREDKIDTKRLLSQAEALSNAKRTYNGFFVVGGILDAK